MTAQSAEIPLKEHYQKFVADKKISLSNLLIEFADNKLTIIWIHPCCAL